MHSWMHEQKAEKERWRGVGCGNRDVCPVCGSYRQIALASEAAHSMSLAQTGLEICQGIVPQSYGVKIVLTIPKSESKRIDDLIWIDSEAWKLEVNQLLGLGYDFVREWYGDGGGGVVSIHYVGESDPGEAHYHINIYVFPGRRVKGVWELVESWADVDRLKLMRDDWKAVVSNVYKIDVEEVNINIGYLGNEGSYKAWLQYLYKHVLADLWNGWQGVEGGNVVYKNGRKGSEILISADKLKKMMQRLPERFKNNEPVNNGLITQHFKRIRWFGIFADGQRAKTMRELGLVEEDVDGDYFDDGDGKWIRSGEVARFVRFEENGVVLKQVLRDKDGRVITDQSGREMLSDEFLVLDGKACYRPSGVTIGKRKRWREPGERVYLMNPNVVDDSVLERAFGMAVDE